MKELQSIEKLEFVQDVFEKLGCDFSTTTVEDTFKLFNSIKELVEAQFEKDQEDLKVKKEFGIS